MLASAQVRVCFAKKTVLCQVRTDPHRICRENRSPCQVLGQMLGSGSQLRAGFAENTVLCAGS